MSGIAPISDVQVIASGSPAGLSRHRMSAVAGWFRWRTTPDRIRGMAAVTVIAAVVLGGTNVMGGRGTYLGTVAGVILITLLQSILSVVQPQHLLAAIGFKIAPDGIRQIVFGIVIIAMLLLYGRERLSR